MTNELAAAAAPLIGAALTYAGFLARQWVKAHVAPKQYAALSGLADDAVAALDQVSKGAGLSNEQKYEMASSAFTTLAKRLGIKVKPDEVGTFIHAAVKAARDEAATIGKVA